LTAAHSDLPQFLRFMPSVFTDSMTLLVDLFDEMGLEVNDNYSLYLSFCYATSDCGKSDALFVA